MEHRLQRQLLRALSVTLIALAALLAVYWTIPLLYPFIIGWIIAYILNPLVNLMQRKLKLPRWLSVSVALLLFIGAISGLITLVITRIVSEMDRLAQYINANYNNWLASVNNFLHSELLQGWIERWNALYKGSDYKETVDSSIGSLGQRLALAVTDMLQGLAKTTINVITALPDIAVGLIVALLAAFFISKDWERLKQWAGGLLPAAVRRSGVAIWADLQKALFGFLRAQFILIAITAVFVIIGLLLLRVPYAVTIGLLIGLVDLMPYLGTGAVFVPWILYTLITGNYGLAFGLTILYAIILIARQLAEPKVLSSSIGLNPLVTLVAIFVGLKLFGFIGLIIGPGVLVLLFSFQRAGMFRDIKQYIVHGRQAAD